MTEAEWLVTAEPEPMLEFLRDKVSDRKLRLFAVACCRRVERLLEYADPNRREDGRRAITIAEAFADDNATHAELDEACWAAEYLLPFTDGLEAFRCVVFSGREDVLLVPRAALNNLLAAELVRLSNPVDPDHLTPEADTEFKLIHLQERMAQSGFLRCIFGNPFRPVALDPQWLTSTVVDLARGIYDERAFDRLPILADALQDAGCDNDDVLNHCRDPKGVHARGCWVVDLVLGKA